MTKQIIKWSLAIALLTLGLVVVGLISPLLFSAVYAFTLDKQNAFISPRNMLGLGIGGFYYATVAVLVFPIAHCFRALLKRKFVIANLVRTIVFVLAVLCSDSRATALGALVVLLVLALRRFKGTIGIVVAAALVCVMALLSAGYLANLFRADDDGNSIKLNHFRSYVTLFHDSPSYLLYGQGADTEFYSSGFESKTFTTELSYMEVLREFGLPVSCLMLLVLVYPIFRLVQQRNATSYLMVPYAMYLFEAASNPLLISSTGLLIVCAIWAEVLTRDTQHLQATHPVLISCVHGA